MSQELWAAAIAELGAACIERVEMNMNTMEEIQPTFEWCLHEMEQLLIKENLEFKNDTNAMSGFSRKNDKKCKIKKIMVQVGRHEKFC